MRFAQRTGLTATECPFCGDPIVTEKYSHTASVPIQGGKTYSAHDGSRHDQLLCVGVGFMNEVKRRREVACHKCGRIGRWADWGSHTCAVGSDSELGGGGVHNSPPASGVLFPDGILVRDPQTHASPPSSDLLFTDLPRLSSE